VLLQFSRRPFWIGFGQQSIGWGLIDALIALIAGRPNSKPFSEKILRRILLFNAALDMLYMLGASSLRARKARRMRKCVVKAGASCCKGCSCSNSI